MDILSFPKYKALLSIDLRCFDTNQPDYGVKAYFEKLGFLPHILMYHETNLDQVHLHDGKIDETKLDYMWITQRGMPGGQIWTRRQLWELVDIVHQYGVKFYQGLEATWQSWPQYDSVSVWPYEHDEIFITKRDGSKTNVGENQIGSINPLVRMKSGEWYEDILCRDLIRYLNDYNMDGYFSADGMAGLSLPLDQADYSDDMIDQFEAFTGIKVKGDATPQKADDIWGNHRVEWTHFYVERWTAFYMKLSGALKRAGKGLATMDAWARSPADSVIDFGFDYRILYEAGLDYYCMESREENWGRRGHAGLYAWESGQVAAVSQIKAYAPDLTLLWALCTCNAPEHWHALRDVPIVLERELMTLPLTSTIDSNGAYKRAYDGYLAIFGIDLNRDEWKWMSDRLDFSFLPDIRKVLGPAIVWSDAVYEAYYRKAKRWNSTMPIAELIAAGMPIRSAVNIKNLQNAKAEGYILVDPMGMPENEIETLCKKREEGADLIVVGDAYGFESILGLTKMQSGAHVRRWHASQETCSKYKCDLQGVHAQGMELFYETKEALPLIQGPEGQTVMSVRRFKNGGYAYYMASTRMWTTTVMQSVPNFDGMQSGFTEFMAPLGTQSYMEALVNHVLPDTLEKLMVSLYKADSHNSVNVDIGQYIAYETTDGAVTVQLENAADLFYTRPRIKTRFPISGVRHFAIKNPSPAGYVIDKTTTGNGCCVNVIPDGMVPVQLLRQH